MLKMAKTSFVVGLALLFLIPFPFSFAHMAGSFEKEMDGYLIDVGHDPNPISADESAYFSAGLLNSTTETPAQFDKVWLRLSIKGKVVYAGTHLPENGFASMSTVLPEGGAYTLSVRFYNGGQVKALAAADFPFTVDGAIGKGSMLNGKWGAAFLIAGMLIAGIIGYVIGSSAEARKRKSLNSKKKGR